MQFSRLKGFVLLVKWNLGYLGAVVDIPISVEHFGMFVKAGANDMFFVLGIRPTGYPMSMSFRNTSISHIPHG